MPLLILSMEPCSPLILGNPVVPNASLHLAARTRLRTGGGIDCQSLKPGCADTEAFPSMSLGARHAMQMNTAAVHTR